MAKVTLYHYNWRKGREANAHNMFHITLGAPENLVQDAWRDGLYEKVLVKDPADALTHSTICESLFASQNDESPRNHRSMSVGDVVQVDDDYYLCGMMGFAKITL